MKLSNFFRVSWLLQLLVGIGLFAVSFLIENQIFRAFIITPFLPILLAAVLELGKAVSIVWHRYLSVHSYRNYPYSIRMTSWIFRIGLLVLSMLCSVLYLANNLDRPNLAATRAADIQQLQKSVDLELANLAHQKADRIATLKSRQQNEYLDLNQTLERRIARIESDLRSEMDNVRNGTFKGNRYKEFEKRLEQEKSTKAQAQIALSNRHIIQMNSLEEQFAWGIDKTRQQYIRQFELERKVLTQKDYANDERANDSRVVAFLKVVESVFDRNILPLQFVFAFSLLVSLLVELGIVLAFDTITVSIIPVVKAQHQATLKDEILEVEISGESRRDAQQHKAVIDRIQKTADRVMEKANDYLRTVD